MKSMKQRALEVICRLRGHVRRKPGDHPDWADRKTCVRCGATLTRSL